MTNLTQHGLMPCWKGGVFDCALSGRWPARVALEARPRGRQGSDHAKRGHARPPRHQRDDRATSSQTKKYDDAHSRRRDAGMSSTRSSNTRPNRRARGLRWREGPKTSESRLNKRRRETYYLGASCRGRVRLPFGAKDTI
eukprot:2620890-Alexandrium_andersonii.AAC.1